MGAVKQDNVQVNVEVNGQKAGKSLNDLEKQSKQLMREIKALTPGTEEFIRKTKELQGVEKQLTDVRKQVKGIKDEMDQSGGGWRGKLSQMQAGVKDLFNSLGPVGGMIASVFAIGTLVNFATSVFNVTAEFQKFEAVLTNTLGSAELAKMAMAEIQDIAASTPFSVAELTESYVKLTNSGLQPTREEIIKLGDLAASQGKDFAQLTEAIIDATAGEFERMKEFGVKASKNGDLVKLTFKGQTTEIANTSEAIKNYITGLGSMEGVAGGMASVSKTLGGQMSNLGDTFDSLFNTIGKGTGGIMGTSISLLSDYVGWVRDALKSTQQLQDEAVGAFTTEWGNSFAKASIQRRQELVEFVRDHLKALNSMLETGRAYNEKTLQFDGERLSEQELEQLKYEQRVFQARMDYVVAYYKKLADKQAAEREKQRQLDAEAAEKAAKEAEKRAKEAEEALKKYLAQVAKDNEAARKHIADLTVALIEDELTRKVAARKLDAEREKEAILATVASAKLKAQELKLVEEQLTADLWQIREEDRKAREEAAREEAKQFQDLINRRKLARADLDVIAAGGDPEDALEAGLAKLQAQMEVELTNTALLEEEKWLITAEYEARKDELREEYAKGQVARERAMMESMVSLLQGGLQALDEWNALHFQKELNQAETAKNSRLAILKGELNDKKLSQEQYEGAVAAVQEQYAAKQRRIKRQEAEAEKSSKLLEATMSTALAVAKALPNIPLSVIAGTLGALQIAKIASTKLPEYSRGGTVNAKGGIPAGPLHSGGGINLVNSQTGEKVGEMEGGEPYLILSRNTMANNGDVIHRLLDASLYRNGARIYENGGITQGKVPAGAGVEQSLTLELINRVAGVEAAVRAIPQTLRAVVVLNDLKEAAEFQQEIEETSSFG